jgi:transposase
MVKLSRPASIEREQLEALPVSSLVELVMKQQELTEQLFKEIERLKGIISQDSKTSSKPPSSDLHQRSEKAAESPSQGEEGKRKAGGQPGHPGKTRKGFGRVDRYEILRPEVCPDCGSSNWMSASWEVKRQQVAQLSQNPIEVVEYQQTGCECAQCHARVIAPFPLEVVEGQDVGVSLQAMLSWLGVYGHLSYEKQQEWLHELGLEVGLGTLQKTTERVAQSVHPSVEELRAWVKTCPQVQVDESPWLVKGIKEWMWVCVGVGFSLFHAGDTRSRQELETLLGTYFAGVLSSDD